MHVFLETERLLLHRFTEDDVGLLVELDSDAEVMRFVTGGVPTPREQMSGDARSLPRCSPRATQEDAYSALGVETTVGILQALTSFEFYDWLAADAPAIEPPEVMRALALAPLRMPWDSHAPKSR